MNGWKNIGLALNADVGAYMREHEKATAATKAWAAEITNHPLADPATTPEEGQ